MRQSSRKFKRISIIEPSASYICSCDEQTVSIANEVLFFVSLKESGIRKVIKFLCFQDIYLGDFLYELRNFTFETNKCNL